MVTHSPVGALPLACFITGDETLDTLINALEMLKSILPSTAFYGNLEAGPKLFMSDNNSEIRDALQTVWPKATLLLCIFHLLQQVWRWLFERTHGISLNDRPGKYNFIYYI